MQSRKTPGKSGPAALSCAATCQFTGFGAGYPHPPITSPGAVTASLVKSGGVTIPLTGDEDFGGSSIRGDE